MALRLGLKVVAPFGPMSWPMISVRGRLLRLAWVPALWRLYRVLGLPMRARLRLLWVTLGFPIHLDR